LKHVCILHRSQEDLDDACFLICQDDLSTAGSAAAFAFMTLEHQDIANIAHRDIRAVAEALADVLFERGLVAAGSPARVLDASQVADLLGRDRQWVYAHAGELGAFRYGDGPRHGSASTSSRWSNGSANARSAVRARRGGGTGAARARSGWARRV
jgi:hypothetical protein